MALPNQITLSVDDDGDGLAPVSEVYDNVRRGDYKGEYISQTHTSLMRDTMTTYVTLPKPTSTFYGVDKGAVKFSHDVEVATPDGGTTRSPVIFQLNGSAPVGVPDATKVHIAQKVVAFVNSEEFLKLFLGMT